MTTRRTFLLGSLAIAGGVAIGYRELRLPARLPKSIPLEPGQIGLTQYVIVDSNGISLIAPRAEMGQGIHTTLAALVAEELDVRLEDVRVEHGPASELYSNWVGFGPPQHPGRVHGYPTQFTGGQTSIKDAFVKMRKAGAAAREVLVRAAAETWEVGTAELATENGQVIDPEGRRLSYVELAPVAARVEVPANPPLKPESEWKILGRSQPRVDMLAKCTGTAEYAIDVRLPDLLYATLRVNPHLGGVMNGYDASRARAMRGVERVVPLRSARREIGVLVIATNTWYALEAARAIDFDWGAARYPDSTEGHREIIRAELDEEPSYRPLDRGDVESALAEGEVFEGEYWTPYLAHATMEPMNATALYEHGRLEIWAGNQNPTKVRRNAAELAGIDEDDVRVHTTYMGGGFGRRLEPDFAKAAVQAALAVEGRPVRVTWSREEDMTHDAYRPMAHGRFRAVVRDGEPVALDLKLSSPSLSESSAIRRHPDPQEGETYYPKNDKFLTAGAWEQPYGIPNYRVTGYRAPNLLPVGWWRGVGESQNSFFHESAIDEIAHAAGRDPLEFRLALVEHAPSRSVLEAVAEMSDWGSELPEGHARGVAYVLSSGAPTAQVVEVARTETGLRIVRAYAAVDTGVALDPRNLEAQVEGALLFGLTAAIQGEITVTNGVVDQTNFTSYKILRIYETPPVEVKILASGDGIHGAGESATPGAAPALGNAIFAATGRRLRELPFRNSIEFA